MRILLSALHYSSTSRSNKRTPLTTPTTTPHIQSTIHHMHLYGNAKFNVIINHTTKLGKSPAIMYTILLF